nr:uncharacterized protein LOC117439301 [Pseudochaenichthys georgianus]
MFRAALELSAIAVLLVEDILKQQSLKKRKRRIRRNRTKWVKSWILQREAHGAFSCAVPHVGGTHHSNHPEGKHHYRDCISVGTRLMVTLRFLATGESFRSLSYQFRVGVSTIRQFVPETCTAIYEVLKEKYLKCPGTVEEWQQVADGFQAQWDFPNCLGALDGKHINIRPPPGTGSTYFNYKHTFSIVLMAPVDSNYKLLYVDVGCNGRISDGGVFDGCSLQDALENRTFNIPAPLPASDGLLPHCGR